MMSPPEWIEQCEARGVNPYSEAIDMAVVGVNLDDMVGAKEMGELAREMMERGYHKTEAA
jgi:hypothetical protein